MVRPSKSNERVKETLQLRLDNPTWSIGDIAAKLGIKSRKSVWETLKRYGLPTSNSLRKSHINEEHICIYCLKQNNTKRRYCSDECKKMSRFVRLRCSYCNKRILRGKYRFRENYFKLRYFNVFCNKEHFKLYVKEHPIAT